MLRALLQTQHYCRGDIASSNSGTGSMTFLKCIFHQRSPLTGKKEQKTQEKVELFFLPFFASFFGVGHNFPFLSSWNQVDGRRARFNPLQPSQTHLLPHNIIIRIMD